MEAGKGPSPAPWARAWEQIDADFEEHLGTIRRFLQCPTVSASDDGMLAGAEFAAALIEAAGALAVAAGLSVPQAGALSLNFPGDFNQGSLVGTVDGPRPVVGAVKVVVQP
mgnify:CR=1 FL=1